MKLEVIEKDCFYHIYNKGINGQAIFSIAENKYYFLRQFDKYLKDAVNVYAYCLMDNHFHFVVEIISDEKKVIQKFSNFFNSYAQAFNKQEGRTGSLFEKHFKRIKLKNEHYLKNLIRYVHLNPKNHLGLSFESYNFSSYKGMVSKNSTKLKRIEVLELFGV
ncbi:transposase [Aquimarina agarivorans]|uniref:transposase n=1 Tax=Aquimarina agarivorans TaxID=980584 RepID=UPI000248E5E4|nr:transposase [Aquimarina agarivorans]